MGTGCLVVVERRLDTVLAPCAARRSVEVASVSECNGRRRRGGWLGTRPDTWAVAPVASPPELSPRQLVDATQFAVVEMRRAYPHRLRSPVSRPEAFRGLCPRSG